VIYNAEEVPDLLGPEGPLAGDLVSYEDRPYQREFALEVARLLEDGGRVAIEAPTGIGKSLGYGLPAAAWAAAGHGPAVVSTQTKALQEQLLVLEAPRLEKAVGHGLTTRVLKGRSNYLCRRRFEAAAAEATGQGSVELLARLRRWVEQTETGDLGECGVRNPRDRQFLAARVSSDPRFCAHSGCTPSAGCFFKAARGRAAAADLLVVNHALLAVHLFGGFDLLPRFDALVVDEAHAFVRVALDHLTLSVGPARIATLLETAPGSAGFVPGLVRSGEGASRLAALHRAMSGVESTTRAFFGGKNGKRPDDDPRQRYRDREAYEALCPLSLEPVGDALGTLLADIQSLEAFASGMAQEGDDTGAAFLAELRRFAEEMIAVRSDLVQLTHADGDEDDRVTWKEWGTGGGFSLNASPLEVGPRVVQALRDGPRSVVFTSATLAAGEDFTFFAREVGMEGDLPAVAYPSPFTFENQALVAAVRKGPDPREPGWVQTTARTLDALMRDPARKTLALFTSYRDLTRVQQALVPSDEEPEDSGGDRPPYEILAQGDGTDAAQLLEAFRRSDRALLLGTASFWEGVDLPGDDLEVLVLTRLPFGVPTEPRFQARAERLEADGGNPFTDLYLPEAVLRFKQGFGRLIRRRSDRGIVAVLDTRLVGKGYGRRFSRALPLPVTVVADGDALAKTAAAWWHALPESKQGETS
jgi:Rad3-related DNA helicase